MSTQLFTPNDLIYSYTRKQAIEDGYQMRLEDDDAEMVKEVGYRYPVYLTSEVVSLINQAVDHPRWGNDWNGVLWDILYMSRRASRPINSQTNAFVVIITGTGRKRNHQMFIECGPVDIDDPTPCLTIMLPHER